MSWWRRLILWLIRQFERQLPVLAGPSDLIWTGSTPYSVHLQWKDNSEGEERFEIWRKVQGHTYDHTFEAPANATTYIDMTAEPSTTYVYKVRAVKGDGPDVVSVWSLEAVGTTPDES